MIFTRFYAIFKFFERDFARHKFSAAKHLKLFCTPESDTYIFRGAPYKDTLYLGYSGIPREGNHVDSQFPQVGVQLAWEPSSSIENAIVVGNEL